MGSPVRVFMSCGDVIVGSYFEVLFHHLQLLDGAVPKMAQDRVWTVDSTKVRLSLTTDSGLTQYPSRINDMYKQADVIVLVFSTCDRRAFEAIPNLIDHITGPVRDYQPVTLVLLGLIPPGTVDKTLVVSPQETESFSTQFGAVRYELDASNNRKEADDFWFFVARSHLAASRLNSARTTTGIKDDVLTAILTDMLNKKHCDLEVLAAMATISPKKAEKALKAAIKATGKKEALTAAPCKIECANATLVEPLNWTVTITNTTKGPVNWGIAEANSISPQYFFAVCDATGATSGALAKGKSITLNVICVFFQPCDLNRVIFVDCTSAQETGLLPAVFFVNAVAPLQPRDPYSTWVIDRKAISIGFRISSTRHATVFRSTLHGAVVAVKEWHFNPSFRDAPAEFSAEWELFIRLKHPNIAQFIGGNSDASQAFIVLEYLKHGQLSTFLHNPPPRGIVRTVDLRLKMATDLAKAMAYLHSQKMLHKDLRSSNVHVDEDCSVKLGDFGELHSPDQLQDNNGDVSALDWTAPEVLTGGEHTTKTDVFSFGVILWEFGAERLPARTFADIKSATLPGLPMDIKTRYPAYVELVNQCTAFAPASRPTFDEIVERLDAIRAAGPVAYTASPIAKPTSAAKLEPPKYMPPNGRPLPNGASRPPLPGPAPNRPLPGKAPALAPLIVPTDSMQMPAPSNTSPTSPTKEAAPFSRGAPSSPPPFTPGQGHLVPAIGTTSPPPAARPPPVPRSAPPPPLDMSSILPDRQGPISPISPGRHRMMPIAAAPPPLELAPGSSTLVRMPSTSTAPPPATKLPLTTASKSGSTAPAPTAARNGAPQTHPPSAPSPPPTMVTPTPLLLPESPFSLPMDPAINAKYDNLIDWADTFAYGESTRCNVDAERDAAGLTPPAPVQAPPKVPAPAPAAASAKLPFASPFDTYRSD